MQGAELVQMAALCFVVDFFTFQLTIHIPLLREREFWCVAKA